MTPSEREEIERVSVEIHKCYCRAYERRFGKPYWTEGDYTKLDEPTKDYDREMAVWHITQVAKARAEALEELARNFDKLGETKLDKWTASDVSRVIRNKLEKEGNRL